MRWARQVALKEDGRSAYRDVVGRLEGKIPLGKPSRRWMKLAYMEWEAWIGLLWLKIRTDGGHL
jgi:hypothetical protein